MLLTILVNVELVKNVLFQLSIKNFSQRYSTNSKKIHDYLY